MLVFRLSPRRLRRQDTLRLIDKPQARGVRTVTNLRIFASHDRDQLVAERIADLFPPFLVCDLGGLGVVSKRRGRRRVTSPLSALWRVLYASRKGAGG